MIRVEHNVETGKITEIELTADEVKQHQADEMAYAQAKADAATQAEAKAIAKAAIADRLGLTADELALLLA